MKKTIAFILAMMTLASVGISVLAFDYPNDTEQSFQIFYRVIDTRGDVTETGILPNPNLKYTWPGVTLENDEIIELLYNDSRPFYVPGDTSIRFSFTADQRGKMRTTLYRSETESGTSSAMIDRWDVSSNRFNVIKPISMDGYYWFSIQNIGSEAFTLNSIHLSI